MISKSEAATADVRSARPPATLYRAVFLISLPFGILDFVLPIYGKQIGADALEVGLFFSAFSMMVVVLRPLIGAGLDRYGRRGFFLASLGGYALTMLVFASSTQVWHIVLARIVQGISSAMFWLSAQAMIADSAGEDARGGLFGQLAQSNSQGSIIGTFIGFGVLGALSLDTGWRPLFLLYAGTGLAALALSSLRLPETLPNLVERKASPIRWTRPWILLLLVTLITGMSWSMLAPVLMFYLQEHFTSELSYLALAFLPAGLVWATLPSRLGKLADRFGRKPLMVLGMVAAAATSFLVPWLTSLWMVAGLWAFQALCFAAGDPAEQALVADLTGGDQRGRGYGLYTMAAGIGAVIGPFVGGWLYDAASPAVPFFLSGAVLLLSAGLLILFLEEPRANL